MKKLVLFLLTVICVMAVSTGCGDNEDPYLYPTNATIHVGDTLHVSIVNPWKHMEMSWDASEELNIVRATTSDVYVVAEETTDPIGHVSAVFNSCNDRSHEPTKFCMVTVLPKEE